jgi:hypothetical protein
MLKVYNIKNGKYKCYKEHTERGGRNVHKTNRKQNMLDKYYKKVNNLKGNKLLLP